MYEESTTYHLTSNTDFLSVLTKKIRKKPRTAQAEAWHEPDHRGGGLPRSKRDRIPHRDGRAEDQVVARRCGGGRGQSQQHGGSDLGTPGRRHQPFNRGH